MRRSTITILAATVALCALGVTTRLDGLAALVSAVLVLGLGVARFRAEDDDTRRTLGVLLVASFLIEAVVNHRHPEAPLANLFGVPLWKMLLLAAMATTFDVLGLGDRLVDKLSALQRRVRRRS